MQQTKLFDLSEGFYLLLSSVENKSPKKKSEDSWDTKQIPTTKRGEQAKSPVTWEAKMKGATALLLYLPMSRAG